MSSADRARHVSDEEILALHDQIREMGAELQRLLDELLRRVVERYEGTEEHAGVIEALAEIQSFRNEHRGTGDGSSIDPLPVERGE